MIAFNSLSSASSLALFTAAAQSSTSQATHLSPNSTAIASSGGDSASAQSPASSTASGSQNFSISVTQSYEGVTESIVNNQLDQGMLGNSKQYLASAVSGVADTITQINSLTSQQISNALYSGIGLSTVGGSAAGGDATGTISSRTQDLQTQSNEVSAIIADQTERLAEGRPAKDNLNPDAKTFQNMTDDHMATFMTNERNTMTTDANEASGVSQAFNKHSLSIKKATDVNGLNYSQTDIYAVQGNTETESVNISDNSFFLQQDGKQHTLVEIGGVALYLSW